MQMLSDDDLNLRELSDEELAQAWDLWFDLAQTTNDADPPYTHGVFQAVGVVPSIEQPGDSGGSETMNSGTSCRLLAGSPRAAGVRWPPCS
jgi:hypothetical protein